MMNDYTYNFELKIDSTAVYLPEQIVAQIDFSQSKRLRMDGEINGIRFECGLMPEKGRWCFLVSKKLQKLCGISPGDIAKISFDIAGPDEVLIPSELQVVLDANDPAREIWESWTAGKKRENCLRVSSVKTPAARQRRVDEVIAILLAERSLQTGIITWQDFERVDLRSGTITAVDEFPDSRKPAYKVTVDFGPKIGTKRTSAQITANYTKQELMGRQVIGVVNFSAKQIGPFLSQFLMVGFYREDGSVILAVPDRTVPNGARLA
jgi:export-related chaperone CsaA